MDYDPLFMDDDISVNYNCSMCHRSFTSEGELNYHMESEHETCKSENESEDGGGADEDNLVADVPDVPDEQEEGDVEDEFNNGQEEHADLADGGVGMLNSDVFSCRINLFKLSFWPLVFLTLRVPRQQ